MVVKRLGPGDDTFHGTPLVDSIFGGGGNDTLFGGEKTDRIWGGEGDDSLAGEFGDDYLYGEFGDDTLDGGNGQDDLIGGAGADLLRGGSGDDFLAGGRGDAGFEDDGATDILYGGDGFDTFSGMNASHDIFYGGAKVDNFAICNDTVIGGTGADIFYVDDYVSPTGAGTNDLTLGEGDEFLRFDFYHTGSSTVIRDFTAAETINVNLFYADLSFPDPIFGALDKDQDGVITRADNGSGTVEGVGYRVAVTTSGTVLDLDGNTITFQNFTGLSQDQWV